MSEIENLKKQEAEIKKQIEEAARKSLEQKILEGIRIDGFRDESLLTYEDLAGEAEQVNSFSYKGIHFETWLEFKSDEIIRKSKITKIEDFKLFDDFNNLMYKSDCFESLYYQFRSSFCAIPRKRIYADGDIGIYLGEIRESTVARKWYSDKKWVCYGGRQEKRNKEQAIEDLKQQIDFFEKVVAGETDARDRELKSFLDSHLEYEMKKRGYEFQKTQSALRDSRT